MTSTSSHLNLNSTLGAVFLGNIISSILYGVTSVQTFVYFKSNQKDIKAFRFMIAILWLLDTVHTAFMSHGVYHYLVMDFGDPAALLKPTWSLLSTILVTAFSNLIVRSVFARRVWRLSKFNNILLIAIVIPSIYVYASGVAFASRGFILQSYTNMIKEESWMLYSALSVGVFADGLIAISLCALLYHSRTGFKSTDSLVYILMLYSINTGLLTSICAAASFISFAIWPHQFIYMGIYFALSKLYVNSLLAVLNSRTLLRERNRGISTIPVSPSSIESCSMGFPLVVSSSSQPQSPNLTKPPPIKLSIRYKFSNSTQVDEPDL